MSVSKSQEANSKSQEANMVMHDLLQPTESALRRSSSVAHLYVCLDRGSKAWVNSQDLLLFAWFLLVDFSLAIVIDDATGHARSGAKKYRKRSRKKVSDRRFKTQSVGLVDAETFFCLAKVQEKGDRDHQVDHPHSHEFLTEAQHTLCVLQLPRTNLRQRHRSAMIS